MSEHPDVPEDFQEPEFEGPSKTRRKREAEALQALGVSLTECTPGELARLPLDESLRDALLAYQDMKAHGARKRQRQLIGKRMRSADADAIQLALHHLRYPPPDPTAQAAADWAQRLADEGDTALTELLDLHPTADRPRLRAWLRTIGQKPDSGAAETARQRLRRYLRELLSAD